MRVLANNLLEQVWTEEVEEQAILVRDTLTGVNNILERLRAQQAPPALVEELFDLRASLSDSLDKLVELGPCFPRRPYGG